MRWLVAVSLVIALAGNTPAQDPKPSPAPTSLLDLTRQAIKLGTTKDGSARLKMLLDAAGARLGQLDATPPESPLRDPLAASYDKTIAAALGVIENGAAQGRNVKDWAARFADATGKHSSVLERVLSRAPDAAKPALARALVASRRGQQDADAAHDRGRRRAARGDRPGATPPKAHAPTARPSPATPVTPHAPQSGNDESGKNDGGKNETPRQRGGGREGGGKNEGGGHKGH